MPQQKRRAKWKHKSHVEGKEGRPEVAPPPPPPKADRPSHRAPGGAKNY